MRFLSLCLFVAVALGITSSALADWPQFRGPGGQGHAEDASGLPVDWSVARNIAWRASIPGEGWSSPIVHDGRVYLTAAVPIVGSSADDHSLRLFCLDAATGNVVWQHEAMVQSGQYSPRIHKKASHANPTPLLDGEQIFAHFGHQGTACFDLDGKLVWTNRDFQYDPVHGNGGSPIVVDDKLIFSCDGADEQFIVALNRNTGAVIWRTPRSITGSRGFSFSTPLLIEVNGRRQVISPASDAVYAYDPVDGREIWRVQYEGGYSVIPRPVFGHGLVYICTGYNTPNVLAIRPDGRGDVTATHIAWRLQRGAPHTPSPLLVGERLYVIADRGIGTCVDAKSGDVIWQQRIGGNFSASPVYADGKIYLQSEEGQTIVLEPGPRYRVLGRSAIHERTLASFAIADGAIFLRSQERLYRIEGK